jgi:hypothetical protein
MFGHDEPGQFSHPAKEFVNEFIITTRYYNSVGQQITSFSPPPPTKKDSTMANTHADIDLSHHLSDIARNLRPNPLKAMYKYWGTPGLIELAGGEQRHYFMPRLNNWGAL